MLNPGLPHISNCYGCSEDNPQGLKIKFSFFQDHIFGEFYSNNNHMGPPGIVHGGVIAAVIDESFSIFSRGLLKQESRTIKAEIHFRKPVRSGEILNIKTELYQETNRALILSTQIYVKEELVADAKGTMFKISKKRLQT